MYTIQTEQFSGPIETLLQLIEERKLEVTQVSLALVTDDFLRFVQQMNESGHERTEAETRFLSDFVAVAARLLLIKSKALLPSLELSKEEEDDIRDLEQRLKFYQQFKPAMAHVKQLYEGKRDAVARPLLLGRQVVFYPSPEITADTMAATVARIFDALKKTVVEQVTVENAVIKLEEKIAEILDRVTEGAKSFGHIVKERSKREVVVLFLALLHLLRDQHVRAEQGERFGEITLNKHEG